MSPQIEFHLLGTGRYAADVRFAAHNGLKLDIAPCPKSANSGSGRLKNTSGEARHPLRIVNLRFWCTVIDVETERRSLDHIARAPLDPRYPDATKVERLGDQSEQVR